MRRRLSRALAARSSCCSASALCSSEARKSNGTRTTMTMTQIHPRETAIADSDPAVHVKRLMKSLDDRPILRGIDLQIAAGEYVAILGANGAGKSTLLKILATLMTPSDGKVELFGEP